MSNDVTRQTLWFEHWSWTYGPLRTARRMEVIVLRFQLLLTGWCLHRMGGWCGGSPVGDTPLCLLLGGVAKLSLRPGRVKRHKVAPKFIPSQLCTVMCLLRAMWMYTHLAPFTPTPRPNFHSSNIRALPPAPNTLKAIFSIRQNLRKFQLNRFLRKTGCYSLWKKL